MNKDTYKNIAEIKDKAIFELLKLIDDIICRPNVPLKDFQYYNSKKKSIYEKEMHASFLEIFKD